jgi:hypothetical protein
MKLRIFVIFMLLTFGTNLAFARQSVSNSTNLSIVSKSKLDSLDHMVEQLRLAQIENERYFGVLQRTNEQLSLWWNPYGIMISMLGILFTILAIIVTFIIFRQSASYRAILNESIQSYQNIINKFLEDKRIEIADKVKELEDKLVTADKKSKKDIQETLDGLKRQRDYINTQVSFGPTPMAGSFGTLTGFPGSAYGTNFGYVSNALGDRLVTCPHCRTNFNSKCPASPIAGALTAQWFDTCPVCKKQIEVR